MTDTGDIQSQQCYQLDEVRDVHPIFRANPFLIEDGLKMVQGEKYLSKDELKHIDLMFRDKASTTTFVEVKWSDVSESQMEEYQRLVKLHSPGSRLIWAVPSDLASKASATSKYGIELKLFEREKITAIKTLQIEADKCLRTIRSLLSGTFNVTMHGEAIAFENPIVACYFEGQATTDKGTRKKLGLKQQSVGRQLDLIRSVATGHLAELHKEKIMLLIWEILVAPYSYKPGKFWRIMDGGFIELVKERQDRPLEKIVNSIWDVVNEYISSHGAKVKAVYSNDIRKYDLLTILLLHFYEERDKVVFTIDELIKFVTDEFEIRVSLPPQKIRHSILNQWVENIVSVKDYANDIAKRLLEIMTLKRMLLAKMGTVDMWILTPARKGARLVAQRQPCQMLSINRDVTLYLTIEQYHGKESEDESM